MPACVAVFILIAAAAPSYAQVAVMVNGEPITNYDIEQRSKLDFLSSHKKMTRKEVIDELIDQKVKIREAKQFGVDPTGSDVDASFAQMSARMRTTPDQLSKTLENQGIRPETLKERIKSEMVWTSLVRGRYKESLQVGEKEVAAAAAVEVKGDEKDAKLETESYEYKMQPIVLLVPRGSAPAILEAKQKEAEALRGRIQTCDEANAFFKSMPNAAIRETVTKTSADLPPALREVLDKTPIGHMTAPEVTKQGVEMVALCGRKQTTVDTPKKKEIRDKMYNEKFEAKSKAYLEQVRKAAMIEYR
ncbi:MAG: peptidylprolyl isomerase [Bradyrhizobium sp.]|jgi:peptidyl-prolyl cis-trans isomerase SurA